MITATVGLMPIEVMLSVCYLQITYVPFFALSTPHIRVLKDDPDPTSSAHKCKGTT